MKTILTIVTSIGLMLIFSFSAFSQTCPNNGDNAVKWNMSGKFILLWPLGSGEGQTMFDGFPVAGTALTIVGDFIPTDGIPASIIINETLTKTDLKVKVSSTERMTETGSILEQTEPGKFTGIVTFELPGGPLSCVYTEGTFPIELTKFSATKKGKEILISWETATELNNDYIAVERSNDGKTFKEIGRLLGAGTSYSTQTYHLADKAPLNGMNYYRLRQVDFDGTVSLSKVISTTFKQVDKGELLAYPTVLQNNQMLNVDLGEGQNALIQLEIFNMNGQFVRSYDVLAKGKVSVLISSLSSGMYIVKTNGLEADLNAKFFVK